MSFSNGWFTRAEAGGSNCSERGGYSSEEHGGPHSVISRWTVFVLLLSLPKGWHRSLQLKISVCLSCENTHHHLNLKQVSTTSRQHQANCPPPDFFCWTFFFYKYNSKHTVKVLTENRKYKDFSNILFVQKPDNQPNNSYDIAGLQKWQLDCTAALCGAQSKDPKLNTIKALQTQIPPQRKWKVTGG